MDDADELRELQEGYKTLSKIVMRENAENTKLLEALRKANNRLFLLEQAMELLAQQACIGLGCPTVPPTCSNTMDKNEAFEKGECNRCWREWALRKVKGKEE